MSDAPMMASRSETVSPTEVAELLEALRHEVHQQRAARHAMRQTPGLADYDAMQHDLQHAVEQLELTRVVSAHWPLQHRTWYERGLNLVHRVVRRSLQWYIHPIVEQQNAFNEVAARALTTLIEGYDAMAQQIARLPHTDHDHHDAPPTTPQPSSSPSVNPPPPTTILQAHIDGAADHEPPAHLTDLVLAGMMPQLVAQQHVNAHLILQGGRMVVLVQRAVRYYLRWLINPIVEQQNGYNTALTTALSRLAVADSTIRAVVAMARAHQAQRIRMEHDRN